MDVAPAPENEDLRLEDGESAPLLDMAARVEEIDGSLSSESDDPRKDRRLCVSVGSSSASSPAVSGMKVLAKEMSLKLKVPSDFELVRPLSEMEVSFVEMHSFASFSPAGARSALRPKEVARLDSTRAEITAALHDMILLTKACFKLLFRHLRQQH